jgi:hypothetical protein
LYRTATIRIFSFGEGAGHFPPINQAKAQVLQYQQQYKDTVAKAKEQPKQAADTTAKAVSRGALFGRSLLCLALWPRFLQVKRARLLRP